MIASDNKDVLLRAAEFPGTQDDSVRLDSHGNVVKSFVPELEGLVAVVVEGIAMGLTRGYRGPINRVITHGWLIRRMVWRADAKLAA